MFKVINTPCGMVKGTVEEGIAAFKGIRYATAKRWCYPELVTAWDGEYDATEYGYSCYQKKAFFDESDKFYFKEFHAKANYKYNEDCLFLNVFVKEERDRIDYDQLFITHR